MFYGVGVSCRISYSIISYLYVSCSGSITSDGEERASLSAISFTCYYVFSVLRGFLSFWVLGMGCVISLWHSLSLPYNYSIYICSVFAVCEIMVLNIITK